MEENAVRLDEGFATYIEKVKTFHGTPAPGVLIGWFMINLARRHLPPERLYDALCETAICLPDAIQLFTPCTIGNGWLTIINYGRFAVTLYDKETGEGVRVFLDPAKFANWPKIEVWFLKKKSRREQNLEQLIAEIRRAGEETLSWQRVCVDAKGIRRSKLGSVSLCPNCGEAYPSIHGDQCLACFEEKEGKSPFIRKGA